MNTGDKHGIGTKCEKIHPSNLRGFGAGLQSMQFLTMNVIDYVPKHF